MNKHKVFNPNIDILDLMENKPDLVFAQCIKDLSGKTFEVAAKKYDLISFTNHFLQSELYDPFLFENPGVFSQEPTYILHIFESDYKEEEKRIKRKTNETNNQENQENQEKAYFTGYICAYMILDCLIDGKTLQKNIDVSKIIEGYDILHTQSLEYATEFIIKNYSYNEEGENKLLKAYYKNNPYINRSKEEKDNSDHSIKKDK